MLYKIGSAWIDKEKIIGIEPHYDEELADKHCFVMCESNRDFLIEKPADEVAKEINSL